MSLLVIGGGLSGLFTAYWASECGQSVVLVERRSDVLEWFNSFKGSAFSIGNTEDPDSAYFTSGELPGRLLLQQWSGSAQWDWYQDHQFPVNLTTAGEIVLKKEFMSQFRNQLKSILRRNQVSIRTDCSVDSFSKGDDGLYRIWFKDGDPLIAGKIVLATGGERNHTFRILRDLGVHEVEAISPAYVRLKEGRLGAKLGSVTRKMGLNHRESGETITGEFTFSARGLEGKSVSTLACRLGRELEKKKYKIDLVTDWLPDVSGAEIKSTLTEKSNGGGRQPIGGDPQFELEARVWSLALRECRIGEDLYWGQLKPKQVSRICQFLKFCPVKTTGMGLPEDERAWSGGVSSGVFEWKTGELHGHDGLYVCGEITDLLCPPGGGMGALCHAFAYAVGMGM